MPLASTAHTQNSYSPSGKGSNSNAPSPDGTSFSASSRTFPSAPRHLNLTVNRNDSSPKRIFELS